jgi:hypothetical protein
MAEPRQVMMIAWKRPLMVPITAHRGSPEAILTGISTLSEFQSARTGAFQGKSQL